MKQCVVVVDDENIVLVSLKRMFQRHFDEQILFEYCDNPEEAIELFDLLTERGIDIPLVISDYLMPNIKGDEFLIKIHEKYPDTLKILLTGANSLDGIQNAVNNAALYQYISKPWDEKHLVLTVKNAVEYYNSGKYVKEQQKKIEEAYKKLSIVDNSKNYFLYLLAHEINTPLTSIILSNQFIEQSITNNFELKDFCNNINDAAERLKQISDLAMFITSLTKQDYKFNFQTYNLSDLIGEFINEVNNDKNYRKYKIHHHLNHLPTEFTLDKELIFKVLYTILDNAIKFSKIFNNIYIIYVETKKHGILSIMDEGVGFSESILENPFEIFSTGDILHHSSGIGLSLAAAKIILDAHNFSIHLSNNTDEGASVRIFFPIEKN